MAGGYSLPAEVTDAHAVWQRLQQAEIPPPRQFSIEDAAGRIVHAATTGQQVDPLKQCRDFQKVEEDRRLQDQALGVMRQAIEQAAAVAVVAEGDHRADRAAHALADGGLAALLPPRRPAAEPLLSGPEGTACRPRGSGSQIGPRTRGQVYESNP